MISTAIQPSSPSRTGSVSDGPSTDALMCAGMSSGPSIVCVQYGASSGTARSNQLSKSTRTSGEAVAGARELAAQIAANGPLALAASKRILVEAPGWAEDELWQRQAEVSGPVFGSEDAREGATAFAEKRDPVWRGL